MAKILFTWELGGGMGHVAPYLSLAKGLRDKGHEVAFVLRDLRLAEISLGQHDFPYFQAPVVLNAPDNPISTIYTFAQILHNVGYGNVELLTSLAKGWRQLFDTYRPDLLLCDYSPTALLASRTIECKKAILGLGFFTPPDITPLPLIRNNPQPDMNAIAQDEKRILENINRVLDRLGSERVDRITQLLDSDANVLMTFKELDHYETMRQQENISYWGMGRSSLGSEPVWPKGEGQRIYAYLKPFKTLPVLLRHLQQLKMPVVIFAPELNDAVKRSFESETLVFPKEPLDLQQTAKSCDIAITNSTHATVATFLRAGKPNLLLPLYIEQATVAQKVDQMGAGLNALIHDPQDMINKLSTLLKDSRYRHGAEAFAKKYADFDDDEIEQRLIEYIDALL